MGTPVGWKVFDGTEMAGAAADVLQPCVFLQKELCFVTVEPKCVIAGAPENAT